jgi:hypothetical protein
MLDLATFKEKYPEFDAAGDDMIQGALDDAEKQIDAEVFGTKTDIAHGLKTAIILMASPYGASMSKAEDDIKRPSYHKLFSQLCMAQSRGWLRVIV